MSETLGQSPRAFGPVAGIPKDETVLSERLTRYTKEMLQWMLRRMTRSDTILCLKFALRLLNVSTDK